MTAPDEIESYRRMVKEATAENPRKEADIDGALRAFDAAFAPPKRPIRPFWLRLPVLMGAAATAAAGIVAVAFLPLAPQMPNPLPQVPTTQAPSTQAPPDLRLALPQEPEAAPVSLADARVLAAFSTDVPQYFPLPWDRGSMLAVLAGTEQGASEKRLFAADGRRLVVLKRGADLTGSRNQDEAYQRFVIALAGLALLNAGEDLGQAWQKPELLAQARAAANGAPAREAAIAAVTGD